eukprot:UN13023
MEMVSFPIPNRMYIYLHGDGQRRHDPHHDSTVLVSLVH